MKSATDRTRRPRILTPARSNQTNHGVGFQAIWTTQLAEMFRLEKFAIAVIEQQRPVKSQLVANLGTPEGSAAFGFTRLETPAGD